MNSGRPSSDKIALQTEKDAGEPVEEATSLSLLANLVLYASRMVGWVNGRLSPLTDTQTYRSALRILLTAEERARSLISNMAQTTSRLDVPTHSRITPNKPSRAPNEPHKSKPKRPFRLFPRKRSRLRKRNPLHCRTRYIAEDLRKTHRLQVRIERLMDVTGDIERAAVRYQRIMARRAKQKALRLLKLRLRLAEEILAQMKSAGQLPASVTVDWLIEYAPEILAPEFLIDTS